MRTTIAILIASVIANLGCARLAESEADSGPAASDSQNADAASGDSNSRDGEASDAPFSCPSKPSDLPSRCTPGTVCRFADCKSHSDQIVYLQCQDWGFEQPLGWYPLESKSCYTENGPDGCPLGGIAAWTACSELGKVCSYRYCDNPATGNVLRYTCETYDGGMMWAYDKLKCAE